MELGVAVQRRFSPKARQNMLAAKGGVEREDGGALNCVQVRWCRCIVVEVPCRHALAFHAAKLYFSKQAVEK